MFSKDSKGSISSDASVIGTEMQIKIAGMECAARHGVRACARQLMSHRTEQRSMQPF